MDFELGDWVEWTTDNRRGKGSVERIIPAPNDWTGEPHAVIQLDGQYLVQGNYLIKMVLPFTKLKLLRRASVYERLALIEPEV